MIKAKAGGSKFHPVRGLGWLFCPLLPKHHPQHKRQWRNIVILLTGVGAFNILLAYLASLEDRHEQLAVWNPDRLLELKKLEAIEEEKLAKEKVEREKEEAMIRLREGYFYVPDKTKAWADGFLKKLEVEPVAENPPEK